MRRVSVDPAARTARAEAGVIWQEVADAAAGHGLAGLAGSSPGAGVAGYTLGAGMAWLGRCYGLSASNAEAFELVTADGRLVRADWLDEPDLFWALCGGGSFGVVTALELWLFPVSEVYAGLLWWPAEAGAQVLQEWRKLAQCRVPGEFSTSAPASSPRPAISETCSRPMRDLEAECLANRDLPLARKLNPDLQNFRDWLHHNASRIPIDR